MRTGVEARKKTGHADQGSEEQHHGAHPSFRPAVTAGSVVVLEDQMARKNHVRFASDADRSYGAALSRLPWFVHVA
jgi:hypothetical protein